MSPSRATVFSALPLLAAASLLPLAAVHCSSKSSAAAPDAGPFTYQPANCPYAVTPPDSRAYLDLALDDTSAPSDAAGAAPQRVRIGLGGASTAPADPTTTAAFTWETQSKTHNAKVRLG